MGIQKDILAEHGFDKADAVIEHVVSLVDGGVAGYGFGGKRADVNGFRLIPI